MHGMGSRGPVSWNCAGVTTILRGLQRMQAMRIKAGTQLSQDFVTYHKHRDGWHKWCVQGCNAGAQGSCCWNSTGYNRRTPLPLPCVASPASLAFLPPSHVSLQPNSEETLLLTTLRHSTDRCAAHRHGSGSGAAHRRSQAEAEHLKHKQHRVTNRQRQSTWAHSTGTQTGTAHIAQIAQYRCTLNRHNKMVQASPATAKPRWFTRKAGSMKSLALASEMKSWIQP
eukprot:1160718-Pelagomonas_calceolata.AAC.6